MTRKSKQILGLFQNFDSNPNMNQNRLVFRGALYKLFYLAIENISKKWKMPIPNWSAAFNRFSIEFEDRMPNQYK